MATNFGVADHISFLGYREDVANLLQVCDAMVLPSIREGLPLTVAEAMAMGKPVIGTAVDGTPEIIADKETGFLVPPRDSRTLSEVMVTLAQLSPNALKSLGENGRHRVEKFFNHSRQTKRVEQLYMQLANR
jgi:glycosyltransferase involved in cell wall biosynthesis